jgi:hypothetical protein
MQDPKNVCKERQHPDNAVALPLAPDQNAFFRVWACTFTVFGFEAAMSCAPRRHQQPTQGTSPSR